MGKQNNENCRCSICNNEIREERQYAALKVGENFVILDAEEVAHLNEFMENRKRKEKQPDYPKIEPEEEKEPLLAYGVLIPQYDSKIKDWNEELKKYIGYAFGTLDEKKLYLSSYREFKLFKDDIIYHNHIPCVLLLDTVIDLKTEKDYGFGYSAFLLYSNMEIFDNILNRDFIFCLGGIEESFRSDDIENWTQYIDKEKLINISQRLF